MVTNNTTSVYLVGPSVDASRRLVETYLQEERKRKSRHIIDFIWEAKKVGMRCAVLRQLDDEHRLEKQSYISIGSLVDLMPDPQKQPRNLTPADDTAFKMILPFVKDEGEARLVLNRYRQSLIILVDRAADAVSSTISNLHQLKIPFYHMRERDLSTQVRLLQRGINLGELPSPFASLSFYEQLSSKPKKKGQGDKKNELDRFFDTFNLPFYMNPIGDGKDMGVRSLFVSDTEMRQTIEYPVKGLTSRFLFQRGISNDLFLLEFERTIPSSHVLRLLQNGILIQGRKHSFLGCSSSGLKKRKAYVISGCDQDAINERQKYGDFQSLASASKQIARFSLLLTQVVTTSLIPTCIKDESDVEVNKQCFTDGCGKLSPDLAAALIRQSRSTLSRQYEDPAYLPSVFQVRTQGIKGIMVIDSSLPKNTIVVRPSMKKFDCKTFPELCICDYSRPCSFGHLNRQYITLLSGLGVPDECFLSIQKEYFQQIRKMTYEYNSALQILEWHNRSCELIQEGESTLETRLQALKPLQSQLISSSLKLKILVPQSRTIFGVAETPQYCAETGQRLPGVLKYGECLIRVTMKGGEQVTLQNQKVVVSKNPCYLLGDIRVLTAVSSLQRPELQRLEKDLVDCIVFPIEGDTPHSAEIAGSDLDGDQYFVCWDARLIPPRIDRPYSYPSYEPKKGLKTKPRQLELIKYFSDQNGVSDLTGRVDSNYKAWAAIKGPGSDECERLGQLFARVVDSAKSGEHVKLDQAIRVPTENRPQPSANATFICLRLEHFAKEFIEEQLRIGNVHTTNNGDISEGPGDLTEVDDNEYNEDESTNEDDPFFDLVSRNHLAMSEFTKFRLIMQHMGTIEAFFHSKYASCVDFGRFGEYELGFAVDRYHVPPAFLSNSLKYYSRIMSNQTAFLKKYVDSDKVPWKLYWRSESAMSILYFSDVLMHALRRNTDALLVLRLPDSVVVALRFSIPFQESKITRKAILFTEQSSCIEKCLRGFIEVSSVFVSENFGYAEEYTLTDGTYQVSIDMTTKSLQLYRGEKRATFAHLRVDETTNGGPKRVQLSVDLTRFNRRILDGRRRHPLVRKAPVSDAELFVSNRTSPYAKAPKKILLADVLLEDGEDWAKSSLPCQENVMHNERESELQLHKEKSTEILNNIQQKFATQINRSYSSDTLADLFETILYPAHRLFGMSCQISSELQEQIESLSMELIYNAISQPDNDNEAMLVLVVNSIPIFSDLGIEMPIRHIPPFKDLDTIAVLHCLIATIRRWDFWLTLATAKRTEVVHWLYSLVEQLGDPLSAFAFHNLSEQAKILLHELKDGSEATRSSLSASRLVNLRIEPNASIFGDSTEEHRAKSRGKMPIVTLYSIQAMPIGLRFATGEHVCIRQQPMDTSEDRSKPPDEFSVSKDQYDKEFPALSTLTFAKRNTGIVSKGDCFCLGRVVSVTEAPFSIKVKLVVPSYVTDSSYVPQAIQECLDKQTNTWFELQVVPANVVAHERIVDAISLVLDPKGDNNLYFSPGISHYLMKCPAIAEEVRPKIKAPQTTLNLRQQEALEKSISNTVSLVHGPPGTGKTTTITNVIKEVLRSSDDRILVCAETNLAVDNLALRMLEDSESFMSPGEMIRVGSGDKVDEQLKSIHLEALVKGKITKTSAHIADTEQSFYLSRHKKIMNEILIGARVVFATTIGAGDSILNGQKFDFVVMDEASMSTEPSCLPALSHGCTRLALVGDHKQLGPHACDSKCVSLFERLLVETESKTIPAAVTMLNQQHRMHSKLCQFPSKAFYDDKLLTAPGIDKARPIPTALFGGKSNIKYVPVKEGREQRMKSGSWFNEVEIGYVLKIIKELTINKPGRETFRGQDITILTPYRAQQARIQIQMRDTWKISDSPPEVCSIDGYQGRENEIIVFSAVRCGSSLGFCDDARRMNVLLTRAKRGLVVVGDRSTLMKSRIWKQWFEMAERE